jgi:hypothetical protein
LAYQSNLELAGHLAARGWIEMVEDPADIPNVLANRPTGNYSQDAEDGRDPKEVLSEFLDFLGHETTATSRRAS